MKHHCPVCNFPDLTEPPRSKSGGGSFEICPSCGFQFGVSDDDAGITYDQWRERWIKDGAKWSSRQRLPTGWDAAAQLAGRVNKPSEKKQVPD